MSNIKAFATLDSLLDGKLAKPNRLTQLITQIRMQLIWIKNLIYLVFPICLLPVFPQFIMYYVNL